MDFHVTAVAKYNEVAKLAWQRSGCSQQMWPDVMLRGLVPMKEDSRVRLDFLYYPDAVHHITHRRSKTQLVLAKILFRNTALIFPEEQTQVLVPFLVLAVLLFEFAPSSGFMELRETTVMLGQDVQFNRWSA